MGRNKQPIELVEAKGAKHLTKTEIAEREKSEVKPITDGIEAPDFLTDKQKRTFYKLSDQLKKLKVMGETDVDALGRYVVAQDNYITAVKKLRSREVKDDVQKFDAWSKIEERYFKECRTAASDLGLTIASRCKLVIPETNAEPIKENKFKRFEKVASGE